MLPFPRLGKEISGMGIIIRKFILRGKKISREDAHVANLLLTLRIF